MRITLNQDELFEAVSFYLRDKLQLDAAASIEISFTAGRGPKGYTADVDITYPKSELATKITAAPAQEDEDPQTNTDTGASVATEAAAAGVTSANGIFD